ncbi:MAG: NPCBM/NEW2 domain-containing protein, partial [Planctomycetota bacterium]
MMSRIRKHRHVSACLLLTICAVLTAQLSGCVTVVKSDKPARTVWLSSLNLEKMTSGWGTPQKDKSIQSKPLKIAGFTFDKGVGTHAASLMYIDLKKSCRSFSAYVGVDDEVNGNIGSVRFRIYCDGKLLFNSGILKAGDQAKKVDIDLTGCRILILSVDPAGDNISHDHANWADAAFFVAGEGPEAIDAPAFEEEKVILTPKPGPEPRINGPKVFGCRPGRPLIYRIPCQG